MLTLSCPVLEHDEEHKQQKLTCAYRLGSHLSSLRFSVLMIVRAAEKRHFVEHVLLEPLEPKIDDRCDK